MVVVRVGEVDVVAVTASEGEERRECLPVATTEDGWRGAAGMTIPSDAAPGRLESSRGERVEGDLIRTKGSD